jgi:HAD superfamily phosphatase (TIGR01681 family)
MAEYNFKVAVFDLDQTLWDGEKLYPTTLEILENLKNANIKMYICSYHLFPVECCQLLGIYDYFTAITYGRDRPKSSMIYEIIQHANVPNWEVVFFDDNINNIIDTKKHIPQMASILVSSKGLTWDLIPYTVPMKFGRFTVYIDTNDYLINVRE